VASKTGQIERSQLGDAVEQLAESIEPLAQFRAFPLQLFDDGGLTHWLCSSAHVGRRQDPFRVVCRAMINIGNCYL
jgi:hypothetical protein